MIKEINPIFLKINNKGEDVLYIGDRSKVVDDFDIAEPFFEGEIPILVQHRHNFDSVKIITAEEFFATKRRITDSGKEVIII